MLGDFDRWILNKLAAEQYTREQREAKTKTGALKQFDKDAAKSVKREVAKGIKAPKSLNKKG
jgi:uncharacterized phage infection (PIP) family protein YhgE